jgi:hypothetical protein
MLQPISNRFNQKQTSSIEDKARQSVVESDTLAYKDGKPGGFDPHKRIPDMDADGIDAAFL